MQHLLFSTATLVIGTSILIIAPVCSAQGTPDVPAPPGGMAPAAMAPLPPQDPTTMGAAQPGAPMPIPPNTVAAPLPQPPPPPATDEEFPAVATTDKQKVQRFMNRIRGLEMRVAMLENRLAMLQRANQGAYPGGTPGAFPGRMQGAPPGFVPPGQPAHHGGMIRPRGLEEQVETGTGSTTEQPGTGEPSVQSK